MYIQLFTSITTITVTIKLYNVYFHVTFGNGLENRAQEFLCTWNTLGMCLMFCYVMLDNPISPTNTTFFLGPFVAFTSWNLNKRCRCLGSTAVVRLVCAIGSSSLKKLPVGFNAFYQDIMKFLSSL